MEKDIAETKDILIAVVTSTDIVSNIKGYHVSKSVWTPILQEQVYGETELHDSVDKYAVAVKKVEKVVGHLPLRENGKFPKTNFYFLCADRYEKCNITVTGKAVNLGDGDGMQVHSILHLSGQKVHGGDAKTAEDDFYWLLVSRLWTFHQLQTFREFSWNLLGININ